MYDPKHLENFRKTLVCGFCQSQGRNGNGHTTKQCKFVQKNQEKPLRGEYTAQANHNWSAYERHAPAKPKILTNRFSSLDNHQDEKSLLGEFVITPHDFHDKWEKEKELSDMTDDGKLNEQEYDDLSEFLESAWGQE